MDRYLENQFRYPLDREQLEKKTNFLTIENVYSVFYGRFSFFLD